MTARRAAIFQRELCEAVLIGLRNYLVRHRRMKLGECFYARDACGIMVDGDDDVRLHLHGDCDVPAEVHLLNGGEKESLGGVTME